MPWYNQQTYFVQDQWPSGRVSTLRLVGCGFVTRLSTSTPKDSTNASYSLPAWHSIWGVGSWRLNESLIPGCSRTAWRSGGSRAPKSLPNATTNLSTRSTLSIFLKSFPCSATRRLRMRQVLKVATYLNTTHFHSAQLYSQSSHMCTGT